MTVPSEMRTYPGDHAGLLALLLRRVAVVVAPAAAVPELGAGVGLLVVVPQDGVVPAGALAQGLAAAGADGGRH